MSSLVQGVLECLPRGGGFLRDAAHSFQPGVEDAWVSSNLIRTYGLVAGASVAGSVNQGKKGPQLTGVESICGLSPEQFKMRTPFERLIAVSPHERFPLGESGNLSMRVVDLIAPIGKGTRGLIVAPPQAGKTQILEEIANAIRTVEPQTRVILLLIDERPEEVTHFRRHVQGDVLASSSDQSLDAHIKLAELAMAHIRCELECGRHIVVLVDSMTRLVRAFNLQGAGARRTLSGGLDAKAMEIPRRFFGLARTIENGGSVTVIGTALIETGSRMDDYVFEELKSTGNSEIVLDRSLAESRIFPAINVLASSTRKEELLYSPAEVQRLIALRRWLAKGTPKAAMVGLLNLLQKTTSNAELLARIKPT
jgi:transcription termination factor Rho